MVLEDAGYFVQNLWSTIDVTEKYECEDDLAMSIVEEAVTSEFIMSTINDSIDEIARSYGLKEL